VSDRPPATTLIETPGAVLSRTDLRDLGWTRTQVDAIFRALHPIFIPGTRRPVVRREDYLDLLDRSTYRDDHVRATG
jgi:hypothetical protein